MKTRIPVAILGATGMVGQRLVELLQDHPWFEIAGLYASEQSANKNYKTAVADRWMILRDVPKEEAMTVEALNEAAVKTIAEKFPLVFSALNNPEAAIYDEALANAGVLVCATASVHRTVNDIPLLIPEINSSHLTLLEHQQKRRGTSKGGIVVKPNCTIQSFLLPIYILDRHFPIEAMIITSLQAVSGAGLPGVPSMSIINNILPWIPNEEARNETEPLKILGHLNTNAKEEVSIAPRSDLNISMHCTRVAVVDGHTTCVSVKFVDRVPTVEDAIAMWRTFKSKPSQLNLPSAPEQTIIYRAREDRPQPRLDSMAGKGMSITVGRLRACNVFDYRFVSLSHNTIRGAAGGSILNAELLYALGCIS